MIVQARRKKLRIQQTALRTDSEVKVDYLKSKQGGPNNYKDAPKDKEQKSATVHPRRNVNGVWVIIMQERTAHPKMLSVMPVKNVGTTRRHAEVNT